jgi:ABC-2 type transport system permease protein
VNAVVARITLRGLLGRRRALLLLLLAAPLLALAVLFRAFGLTHGAGPVTLLRLYGLGTLLPLVALIAGTGVLSPEIDDGTIVYLLSKPVDRPAIVQTKLAVAVAVTALGSVPAIAAAALVLVGLDGGVAAGVTVAALLAAVAYSAVFVLLSIVTRHAVIAGLAYALIWESLIGQYVPGARLLSVQQWAVSVGGALSSAPSLRGEVAAPLALVLLAALTAVATALAGQRLRSFSLTGES